MLKRDDIMKIIPHRAPFLLIDEVTELSPLKRAVGYKHVKEDEDFFKGHFPDFPVMPGVLVLESMAQLGAVAALSADEFKNKIVFLTGVDDVKFRRSVFPGETLKLTSEVKKIKHGYGIGFGQAFVGEELVCEAKIKFAIK